MEGRFKRKEKMLLNSIRKYLKKINRLHVAIGVMIAIGVGTLIFSYWIIDNDKKNIFVGLGTGIVTSAMVSLYIDVINSRIEKGKLLKYKNMLLNPLYNAIRLLYIHIALNINEYRVREKLTGYLFLPMEETTKLSDFFYELKAYDLHSIGEVKRKELDDMLCISEVYYREVISQFRGLPLDSLLYENLISREEYEKLKKYDIINVCMKNLSTISENGVMEQYEYVLRVQLLHAMMLQINRILKVFPDMASKVNFENSWIKEKLDDIYYYEVYMNSEEYAEEMMERMEAEAEYYAEYPEECEAPEETQEDRLHRKINEAIWAGNAEIIKQCFGEIDKNNKQIQSELTWSVAKNVMRDKELRKLYYEKYGEKYKMRKDKSRLIKKIKRYMSKHFSKKN